MKHDIATSKSRPGKGLPQPAIKGCMDYDIPLGPYIVHIRACEPPYLGEPGGGSIAIPIEGKDVS